MPKKKLEWDIGDVFAVEQLDDNVTLGQVLDLMMPNVVTCAFFDIRFPKGAVPADFELDTDKLISVASVSREQLDYGEWPVVSRGPVEIERDLWPNEKYRDKDWVGAKIYDAAIHPLAP